VTGKGIVFDLLKTLGVRFNFTYLLVPASDNKFGVKSNNGQWSGMIGQLQRNEGYLAAAPFAVTKEPLEVVNFTHPFDIQVLILYPALSN